MLMQQGTASVEFTLEDAVTWSADDVALRREVLRNYALRLASIGSPEAHTWRGVDLSHVLPTELDRILQSVGRSRDRSGAWRAPAKESKAPLSAVRR